MAEDSSLSGWSATDIRTMILSKKTWEALERCLSHMQQTRPRRTVARTVHTESYRMTEENEEKEQASKSLGVEQGKKLTEKEESFDRSKF